MERKKQMSVKDLIGKFRSKRDLYHRVTEERKVSPYIIVAVVQYFMPNLKMWPISFIKNILSSDKLVSPPSTEASFRPLKYTKSRSWTFLITMSFSKVSISEAERRWASDEVSPWLRRVCYPRKEIFLWNFEHVVSKRNISFN